MENMNSNEEKEAKTLKILIAIVAILLLLVIGFFTFIFVSRANAGGKYDDHIKAAEKYIDQLEYELAIAELEEAIEIDDKEEEAYLLLSDVYVDMEEYDKAVDVLEDGQKAIGEDNLSDEYVEQMEDCQELLDEHETADEATDASDDDSDDSKDSKDRKSEKDADVTADTQAAKTQQTPINTTNQIIAIKAKNPDGTYTISLWDYAYIDGDVIEHASLGDTVETKMGDTYTIVSARELYEEWYFDDFDEECEVYEQWDEELCEYAVVDANETDAKYFLCREKGEKDYGLILFEDDYRRLDGLDTEYTVTFSEDAKVEIWDINDEGIYYKNASVEDLDDMGYWQDGYATIVDNEITWFKQNYYP